ncbi:MAG: glycoside hydrolase family 31 protein [Candidatus Methylacidiphilales bacterium]|nr:glycoside hydrolase family 31 protein [Candidatus Methylacidiphilales bacterium]
MNYSYARRVSASGFFMINKRRFRSEIQDLGHEIFRWRVTGSGWTANESQVQLTPPCKKDSASRFLLGSNGGISLRDGSGHLFFQSAPGQGFGVSGSGWVMQFLYQPDYQFYGMGQKNNGFEKSHLRTKFWNTDVFGDFPATQVWNETTDPMYVSVPYLIIKRGNTYSGILVNNPHAVFMDTDSNYHFAKRPSDYVPRVWIGSEQGMPEMFIIHGPDLPGLTRKLQQLCGTTPRPPLWALGNHQSRWGYAGIKDLEWLDREHRRHGIPCDGHWLDIDYMENFKVFSFNPAHFRNVRKDLAGLRKKGRRVVAILDPGVKMEKGYPIYDEGSREGHFCLNLEKKEFVGHVWPGETVYPDFSQKKTRDWWARHVAEFARQGIAGSWIDMNDPSVAGAEPFDMLFRGGRANHSSFHNQYALGMARATRDGFLQAHPNRRPFVISRSGFIGQCRYSAIWNGDNVSNYFHLKNSIPMTLNLALSGIPYNGPDVPGFARNASPQLAIDWYKTAFLFPFMRNHSEFACDPQEPWRYGPKVLGVIRHYVRLRYKMLPYLYNLFIRQEATGEAIMRPLFHDFEDTRALPLGKVDDQFLIGPDVMQAPVVEENQKSRSVLLPGKKRWFSALEGEWVQGGRRITAAAGDRSTPLYFREGAIVPMKAGERGDPANDLARIEFHVFLARESKGSYHNNYIFDDGETFDYRRRKQTELEIKMENSRKGLKIDVRTVQLGYKPCRFRVVLYADFPEVLVTLNGRGVKTGWRRRRWTLTGKSIKTYVSSEWSSD